MSTEKVAILTASAIAKAFTNGKLKKREIAGVASALALFYYPCSSSYKIGLLLRGDYGHGNLTYKLRREAEAYGFIRPVAGTSPLVWELTDKGRELCKMITKEIIEGKVRHDRRVTLGRRPGAREYNLIS